MTARNWSLSLISVLIILLFVSEIRAVACSQTPLQITDLTGITESTSACPTAGEDDFFSYTIRTNTELKGTGNCDEFGFPYTDRFETVEENARSKIGLEGGVVGDILAGDSFTLSYDSTSLEVFYPLIDVDGGACDAFCIHYIATDGSTYDDSGLTVLAYGAGGCTLDSCTPPASGDWTITDVCTLNSAKTITGNLIISSGSLEIQGSGVLTVSGGFAYIYSGTELTILSGGQLNG